MKKILFVSHSAGNGGSERVATLVANHLADQGHEVVFCALHSDARTYKLNEHIKYVFCKVAGHGSLVTQIQRMLKLNKLARSGKFDVMIAFTCLEGYLLIGNHKLKKIYSLRNDPASFYDSGIYKSMREKLYRDADQIVFQTPDARDYFPEDIRRKGVLIANPIKQGLPVWDKENHKKEIIAVCRLAKQKNLNLLVDAFEIFCEHRDDYKLVIYGKGPAQEELEAYIDTKKIKNKIELPGFCDDVHSKMIEAEIYVSSSDYEGISNSMLEALAIGIPTICTDCPVGGARMFIESGRNGFLVPVGNKNAMAERMLELAADKELQKSFSENSQHIRKELSHENIFEKWDRLIQ